MTLSKRGGYWYGTEVADIQPEIVRYSRLNEYEAVRFATARCACGGTTFRLRSDAEMDAATPTCTTCDTVAPMGDSADCIAEASLDDHECVCGGATFAIASGAALYADSIGLGRATRTTSTLQTASINE